MIGDAEPRGADSTVVPPGGAVGILGAGQLGRMLAVAASRMGLRARLLDPAFDPPAGHVASTMQAAWDDAAALRTFARSVDVVTLEFENVPRATVETLAQHVPVYPSARALRIAQDRYEEKTFLNAIGIKTAHFAPISTLDHLSDTLAFFDAPAILKTRRMGYDGKGQVRVDGLTEAGEALATFKGRAVIVEKVVPFETEISVIVARGRDGSTATYDPAENTHESGILRRSMVPAVISDAVADAARDIAVKIVESLDYVGVMGVEFFVLVDDSLLVNEIAPRVHNTGHWSIEACAVNQFEQHIRAVCGWPLGATDRNCDAVMDNLLGDEVQDWRKWAGEPRTALHIYGKKEAKPGRKMGHITRLSAQ